MVTRPLVAIITAVPRFASGDAVGQAKLYSRDSVIDDGVVEVRAVRQMARCRPGETPFDGMAAFHSGRCSRSVCCQGECDSGSCRKVRPAVDGVRADATHQVL